MSEDSSQGFYLHHLPRYALLGPTLEGSRVLQLGGGAYAARVAVEAGALMTCALSGDDDVARARATWASTPRLRFERASLPSLPFAPGSFDRVFAFEILTQPTLQQALDELTRVLDRDGYLVVTVPIFSRDVLSEIMGEGAHTPPPVVAAQVHEALSARFAHVMALQERPWLGYSVEQVDGVPRPTELRAELVPGEGEPPLFLTFLASELPVVLEEDALIQVPFFHLVDRINEGLRTLHRALERKNNSLLELREELALLRRRNDELARVGRPEVTPSLEEALPALPPAELGDGGGGAAVSKDEMRLLMAGLMGEDIEGEIDALSQGLPPEELAPPPPPPSPLTAAGDPIFQEDLAPFALPGPVPLPSELRAELRDVQGRLAHRELELARLLAWRELMIEALSHAEERIFRELASVTRVDIQRAVTATWSTVAQVLELAPSLGGGVELSGQPLADIAAEWEALRARIAALEQELARAAQPATDHQAPPPSVEEGPAEITDELPRVAPPAQPELPSHPSDLDEKAAEVEALRAQLAELQAATAQEREGLVAQLDTLRGEAARAEALREENAELRAEIARQRAVGSPEDSMDEPPAQRTQRTSRHILASLLRASHDPEATPLMPGPPPIHFVQAQPLAEAETDGAGVPRDALADLPPAMEEPTPASTAALLSEVLALRRVLGRALAGAQAFREGSSEVDTSSFLPQIEPHDVQDAVDSLGLIIERTVISIEQLVSDVRMLRSEVGRVENSREPLERELAALRARLLVVEEEVRAEKASLARERQEMAQRLASEGRAAPVDTRHYEEQLAAMRQELLVKTTLATRLQQEIDTRTAELRAAEEGLSRREAELATTRRRLREVIVMIDGLGAARGGAGARA